MSPDFISVHINHYNVVYCPLQKIYRQPLKKITYQVSRKGLGFQLKARALGGKAKALGCKANDEH